MLTAVLLLVVATLLTLAVVLLLDAATLLMPAAVLLLAVLQLDANKKWRKVVPNCLWMLS